jgi:uncharacterized membrane protein YdfJ with MMPL/SSD domain
MRSPFLKALAWPAIVLAAGTGAYLISMTQGEASNYTMSDAVLLAGLAVAAYLKQLLHYASVLYEGDDPETIQRKASRRVMEWPVFIAVVGLALVASLALLTKDVSPIVGAAALAVVACLLVYRKKKQKLDQGVDDLYNMDRSSRDSHDGDDDDDGD